MIASIFTAYIKKFLPKLQTLIEKVNDKRNEPLTYLHKTMLRTEYAADNKWESTSINTTYVAADYVSQDSEAPIKKRDSIASANGKLPKVAIAKKLKESEMTAIRIMQTQGGTDAQIATKLAQDPVACATGIDERNEHAFLFGLYNGWVALKDEDNPSALLRMNFNYLPENMYKASVKNEIDLDDVIEVINKANEDGNTITHIAVSKVLYDRLRKTRKARQLAADYVGQTYTEQTQLPVPSPSKFNDAFADETNGVTFEVIDRTIVLEQDGKRTKVKPFGNEKMVFYCSDIVGTLVYGRLAEQDNPVDGVDYTTIDGYKLIARFRETNPLREMTTGQAFVAPVLEDIDQIYVLDIAASDEVDETKESADTTDVKFTWNGKTYSKPSFVTAFNKIAGTKLNAKVTDENLMKAVNGLSESDEAKLAEAVAGFTA